MKLIAIIMLGFISSISYAESNPLLGAWELDKKLTFSSLKGAPNKLSECYEKNACGNFRIEFNETSYRIVMHTADNKSEVFTQEYKPYKIISRSEESVKAEEAGKNGQSITTEWLIHENNICHMLSIEGFAYAECFKKVGL